ncbi:MAG: hypothetical protein OXN88_01650 [Chloroflexota bacterium]|nr:hypothetical protein [Chloroflexota bacterium]
MSDKRPKILWACTDQQRYDTLGCTGKPYESICYPPWFYFGQGGVRGVIPIAEYDTFDEAFANVEIWEPSGGCFSTNGRRRRR